MTLALALVCQDDFGNLADKSDSPFADRLSTLSVLFRGVMEADLGLDVCRLPQQWYRIINELCLIRINNELDGS